MSSAQDFTLSFSVCVFVCCLSVSTNLPRCVFCVLCVLFSPSSSCHQGVNPYTTVVATTPDSDHRYCVLKFRVPYSHSLSAPVDTSLVWNATATPRPYVPVR